MMDNRIISNISNTPSGIKCRVYDRKGAKT